MQYLLLIYTDEQTLADADREHCYVESTAYAHRLNDSGKYIAAAPLYSTATATSVRMREDKRFVTDGPFAETREQLGGFFMVNARDLDEALEIAAGIPGAKFGTVEIRPVLEIPQLPESFSARAVDSKVPQSI
jgi:hypothetical protein